MRKEDALIHAENMRNEMNMSHIFIQEVTVSIGLVSLTELDKQEQVDAFFPAAMSRFYTAKSEGGNTICSDAQIEDEEPTKKIMVVDMDSANQEILKISLENSKYEVVLAKDGLEALSIAEEEHPDLIITEVMLPKLDGFVLYEKLLQNAVNKDISVILVSDFKNEESVKRAIKLGIEHYFKKPYILHELLGIVQLKLKGGG